MDGFLAPLRAPDLSAALFGKLIFLVWSASGRRDSPSDDELNDMLLSAPSAVPPRIATVLHIDKDSDDSRVRELTEYILSAQEAGLISRLNPSYKVGELRIGSYNAAKLLDGYRRDFAEVIEWLEKQLSRLDH